MALYLPTVAEDETQARDVSREILSEADPLERVRDCFESQKEAMRTLHGEWALNILYAQGQQDVNFDRHVGFVPSGWGMQRNLRSYNLIRGILERQRAMLLKADPKREVVATTEDTSDIEAAKWGNYVLRWMWEEFKVGKLRSRMSDFKVKTGNVDMYCGWDPSFEQRDPDTGQMVRVGKPFLFAEPSFRWYWDPRAATDEDAQWAQRVTLAPIEWIAKNFGEEVAKRLNAQRDTRAGDSALYFEQLLMDARRFNQGGGLYSTRLPRGKTWVRLWEHFEVPSPDFPQGLLLVCASTSEGPTEYLKGSANPYGDIPCVHMNLLPFTGRFHGESLVNDLIDPQIEHNLRRRQISKICSKASNPFVVAPNDGTPDSEYTNLISGVWRRGRDGFEPHWATPLDIPAQIIESDNAAVVAMDRIGSPFGQLSAEAARESTSGIHAQIIQENVNTITEPMIAEDQDDLDRVWNKALKYFRKFAAEPRHLRFLDAEGTYRMRAIHGGMLSENMRVRFDRASLMPTNRAAKFAEVIEVGKVLVDLANPAERQRALGTLGMGSIVEIARDASADLNKANDNLIAVQFMGAIPTWEVGDNAAVHLERYMSFRKSQEFREWKERDPMGAVRFDQMVMTFQAAALAAQQEAERQMFRAAAMQAQIQALARPQPQGGGDGGGESPVQAGKRAPQGAKATQGFGEMRSPNRNEGGRPKNS